MNPKPLAIATTGMALILLIPGLAMGESGRTYEVTITNLTAGQPLTPPVLATHSRRTGIFTVGEMASFEIKEIAENGNLEPLLTALGVDVHVHQVVAGMAPLVPANNPGMTGFASSETFWITAYGRANYLSFASMLICTNDGFTGLDSVSLPKKSKTVYAMSYDTRTEQNTEDFADIVGGCQALIGVSSTDVGTNESHDHILEGGIIIPHVGILGGFDLSPDVHGWSDPVAKIEIKRVRQNDDDSDSDSG